MGRWCAVGPDASARTQSHNLTANVDHAFLCCGDGLCVFAGVFLTIACPMHELLDRDAVIAALPHGHVVFGAQEGGMMASTGAPGDRMLVALASVVVGYVDDT